MGSRIEGAIDLHAHYLPPSYQRAIEKAGITHPEGGSSVVPEWHPEANIELMERVGIATAMIEISSPGLLLSDDLAEAQDLARRVNEEGASIIGAHRPHFGLLASLPLPDVDAALKEAAYALDELHADGISLLTNYAGHYLGDPSFEPLMEELDRRVAVAVIHPTSPACHEAVSFGRSRGMIEFMFDTARSVVNLALNGVFDRFRALRWVVPHGGGVLPLLRDRVQRQVDGALIAPGQPAVNVEDALSRLFYDLAGGPLPRQLPALLTMTTTDHLVIGTDYPFTPAARVEAALQTLGTSDFFPAEVFKAISRDNALGLFPHLTN